MTGRVMTHRRFRRKPATILRDAFAHGQRYGGYCLDSRAGNRDAGLPGPAEMAEAPRGAFIRKHNHHLRARTLLERSTET
jgi:hypothetical protein